MHWLYNAFSSSSSSPSSSADDNYISNWTHSRMSDAVSLFSPHRRRGTGSTRNQHINENDVVQAPSRSVSTPHILPLPELSALFKRDSCRERAVNQKCNHILPSPENAPKKSVDKRGKRIASVDRVRNTEHKESQFLHKWTQGFSFTAISRDHGHKHCENVSASTMTTESPMSRRDSSGQATVATAHPLPLPPGASGLPPCLPPETVNSSDLLSKAPRESRWQKGKLIGRGTFGSVFVGSNRETGALCAMKEVEILPDDSRSAESMKQLEQEIDVLSQLKHPNIVQYYGSEIVEDRFYIYLEYVHPGSINKYARDHCGGMTESIVRNFTRHIVSGLAYLHSTKTIHRDIKGANLRVDANGVVKLADFGMAKNLDGQVNLSLKGSPYWMAPELLQGGPQKDASPDIALAVDIWSLGCTIIEMMNGKPPWSEYEGPAAMFKVLKETPPIPKTMSPDGKDFLRCCFIRNPVERPTATMLLEHKFLMVQNRREHLT